jgi:hypothetical protein
VIRTDLIRAKKWLMTREKRNLKDNRTDLYNRLMTLAKVGGRVRCVGRSAKVGDSFWSMKYWPAPTQLGTVLKAVKMEAADNGRILRMRNI